MKPVPKISAAEWEVMKVIWREAPCTAQTVIDKLSGPQEWGAATIKTLLTRLVRKKALRFEKEGRAYVYSPTVSEAESRSSEADSFIDRVFGGALSPFLSHFASSGRRLTAEDLAELEKIVKQTRRKP